MECTQVREELSALIDGELSPEVRAAVEAHLAQCPDCLREADDLKRLDSAYRALPPLGAPEGFEQAVAESLQSRPVTLTRPSVARRQLWPLLATAATLVAVVAGILVYMRPQVERFEIARNTLVAAPTVAEESKTADAATPVEQKTEEGRVPSAPPEMPSLALAPAAPPVPAPAPASVAKEPAAGAIGREKPKQETKPAKRKVVEKVNESAASNPVDTEAAEVRELSAPQTGGGAPSKAEPPAAPEDSYAPAFAADAADGTTPKMGKVPEKKAAAQRVRSAVEAAVSNAEAVESAALAKPAKQGETRVISGRTFEFRDGLWRQKGYAGEACTRLTRDSEALRAFLGSHPDTRHFCELRPAVLFKSGNAWYKLQ